MRKPRLTATFDALRPNGKRNGTYSAVFGRTASHHGIGYCVKTPDEAEEAITDALERLYRGPRFYGWRGYVGVIWPTESGYASAIVAHPGDKPHPCACLTPSAGYSCRTLEEEEDSMVLQLCQIAWNGEEATPICLGAGCDRLRDRWEAWLKFQLAYRTARANGADNDRAWQIAAAA